MMYGTKFLLSAAISATLFSFAAWLGGADLLKVLTAVSVVGGVVAALRTVLFLVCYIDLE